MAGVSNYKTGAIVVHTTFAASDEQMACLSHGSSAVQEGRTDRGGTVTGGGSQTEFVAVSPYPVRLILTVILLIGYGRGTYRTKPSAV